MTNEQKESFYMAVANIEGFRSSAYYCPSGHLTIGFGHRITDSERQQYATVKLTFKQAYDLLVCDFEKVFDVLAKQDFKLQENELFAVADLCFNTGFVCLYRPFGTLLRQYSVALGNNMRLKADELNKKIQERFLHYCHYKRNGKVYTSDGLLARRRFDVSVWTGAIYAVK